MLRRGNHKSAEEARDEVMRLFLKDVTHGFSMPFDPKLVLDLKGSMVQPCGMVKQFSLQSDGSRVKKNRLTQDLSFSLKDSSASVNDRLDMEQYPEMIHGWCLLRVMHFVVALRLKHPRSRMFISKCDFSDACRRMAHAAAAAAQSIVVFANIAFMALRMTFGGSANPPAWCTFSEMVTDLANELSLCEDWDPANCS